MYTISTASQPAMKVNIRNQCLNFILTDRRGFNSDAYWNKQPDWEVDAGNMMSIGLIPFLSTFGGALAYQLQRKNIEFDDQPVSTYIRLFVAWKSESHKKFRAFSHLIEHEEWCEWDKTELEEYYQRHLSRLSTYTGPIKDTWLTRGGVVLMTRLELDITQKGGVLNITISEGVKDDHTKRSVWIRPES
jgi:hypothetical protein